MLSRFDVFRVRIKVCKDILYISQDAKNFQCKSSKKEFIEILLVTHESLHLIKFLFIYSNPYLFIYL